MSVYSKLDRHHAALKTYLERHKKILNSLINANLELTHPLLNPLPGKKKLFVLIATNKGLCGSLNTNLFRHFEHSDQATQHEAAIFITIGQKAKRYVQEHGFKEIVCSYNELNGENYKSLTNDLIDRIFSAKEEYSSVIFYSNHLQGFFKQQPHTTQLTPLLNNTDLSNEFLYSGNNTEQTPGENDFASWTWEQSHTEVFDYLIGSYLKAHISNLLYDAILAEHAARFFAMDNSTTNANKLLEYLSMQYNKQRQTLITKEVAELSSFSLQHESSR